MAHINESFTGYSGTLNGNGDWVAGDQFFNYGVPPHDYPWAVVSGGGAVESTTVFGAEHHADAKNDSFVTGLDLSGDFAIECESFMPAGSGTAMICRFTIYDGENFITVSWGWQHWVAANQLAVYTSMANGSNGVETTSFDLRNSVIRVALRKTGTDTLKVYVNETLAHTFVNEFEDIVPTTNVSTWLQSHPGFEVQDYSLNWTVYRLNGSTAVPDAAPSGLTATATSSSTMDLAWTRNATNEAGFLIDRSLNGTTGWANIAYTEAAATSYTDSGLSPNTQYFYRVRAHNAMGDSANTSNADDTTEARASSSERKRPIRLSLAAARRILRVRR